MQTYLQFLATFACAIFTGASIYINLVEHPARMTCGIKLALAEWIPSYKRATIMQASLAILGFIFSLMAWLIGSNIWWLLGGIALGLVVPYTFMAIMPVNKRLLSPEIAAHTENMRFLLEKWNKLHLIRSLLSTIALIIFLLNL